MININENDMDFCQYKDLFGEPNQGLHSYRIFDIAVVDVLSTIFGAFLISWVISQSFILIFIVLIILSVVLHRSFCVDTRVDRFLKNNLF